MKLFRCGNYASRPSLAVEQARQFVSSLDLSSRNRIFPVYRSIRTDRVRSHSTSIRLRARYRWQMVIMASADSIWDYPYSSQATNAVGLIYGTVPEPEPDYFPPNSRIPETRVTYLFLSPVDSSPRRYSKFPRESGMTENSRCSAALCFACRICTHSVYVHRYTRIPQNSVRHRFARSFGIGTTRCFSNARIRAPTDSTGSRKLRSLGPGRPVCRVNRIARVHSTLSRLFSTSGTFDSIEYSDRSFLPSREHNNDDHNNGVLPRKPVNEYRRNPMNSRATSESLSVL